MDLSIARSRFIEYVFEQSSSRGNNHPSLLRFHQLFKFLQLHFDTLPVGRGDG